MPDPTTTTATTTARTTAPAAARTPVRTPSAGALLAAGAAVTAAAVLRSGPAPAAPAAATAVLEGQVVVLALGALGPPLLFAGLVLLLRGRVRRLAPAAWVDAPVLALLASAAAGAVLLPWFREVSGAGGALSRVLLERTVLDVLVAALAVGACAVLGRPRDPRLLVLAAATTTAAVVDLLEVAHLTGALGGSLAWAAGWGGVVVLLLALGAVAVAGTRPLGPPVPLGERPPVGAGATLLGPVLALGLLGVLVVLVAVRGASPALLVMTLLGVVGVALRVALVVRELARVTAPAAGALSGAAPQDAPPADESGADVPATGPSTPRTPGADSPGAGSPGAAGSKTHSSGAATSGEVVTGRVVTGPVATTGTAALAELPDAGGRQRVAAPLFRRRPEQGPAGGGVVVGHRALSQQLARAAAEGRAVHLVVLDLHGVDALEEASGRGAAARLVLRTGQLLLAAAGPEALVARTGEAEHAVLVPGGVVASGLAHRLVAAVGATAAGHDPGAHLVVGAGVASRSFEAGSPAAAGEDLLHRAAAAARASRVAGGGVTVDGFRTAPGPARRRPAPVRTDAPEPWLLELRARREAVAASTTTDAAW